MTSKNRDDEAFVWAWLPGETEPVVAGRVERDGDRLIFNYGRSYLGREDAIALHEPELPLRPGAIAPLTGLSMAGCLRDAAPDAWGRRVIINRKFGHKGKQIDVGQLDELTYLLESGSDRIGALDFQRSATTYAPRGSGAATLEQLLSVAERVESGTPMPPDLDLALFHGSSIGGARPKAIIDDGERKLIAKFSSRDDVLNVVKGEFVAMRLAAHVGLDVAPVQLVRAAGKDVLLIERFDRERAGRSWRRKAMVSALTLFELDEMMARYASYEALAEIIRHRFDAPDATLRELFGRLVFNILCGNTDDHARNHAAFWNGRTLTLTPAYDICPQSRAGGEAGQAMLITGQNNMSTLAVCLQAAPHFHLGEAEAIELIERQLLAIRDHWPTVREDAGLTEIERALLWRRQLLNPFAFQDAPDVLARFATEE
ncbi:MAG: type II toxin-antitoxin system HipA family toxin [Phenylobacterium sp.]|uniref:type II toxin-antitoxin system HipA family toxin n=1 Tax=Phenylobacterium sp. TaxID=1871053 RepID=UPI002734F990|nr:type II toxin-antitoxin system HipA family toxin [Phenylobacterium sp.]MDP3745876.1 type II toxin-antitoxin system HipA family toxin [Phenylobacterium sp.]